MRRQRRRHGGRRLEFRPRTFAIAIRWSTGMPARRSSTSRHDRARVLVADDHPRMRDAITTVLSSAHEVVAAVADGRAALDAVERLDPDVAVLDITMPVLDGFHVAREVVARGGRTRILFLTVHADDEYVAAAVDAGVHGYVVKSRVVTDLVDAVSHVLAGRLRVPTLSSLLGIADPRARCAAHFCTGDDERLAELQRFAARALRRGDAVTAVGAPALLHGVASRLTAAGFDLASLGECGRYTAIDAVATLPDLMRGDEPDEASLNRFVDGLERRRVVAAEGQPRGQVVFGELAAVLLRQGNAHGALAIERLWHGHACARVFHTACSYNLAFLKAPGRREVFDGLRAVHEAVSA
jgi:DNA-binding NarL/FixJ family response regulator